MLFAEKGDYIQTIGHPGEFEVQESLETGVVVHINGVSRVVAHGHYDVTSTTERYFWFFKRKVPVGE